MRRWCRITSSARARPCGERRAPWCFWYSIHAGFADDSFLSMPVTEAGDTCSFSARAAVVARSESPAIWKIAFK